MQTFSDLSPSGYNSLTSVVWLEQFLHIVVNPKTPPERTPFLTKNLSIFLVYINSGHLLTNGYGNYFEWEIGRAHV